MSAAVPAAAIAPAVALESSPPAHEATIPEKSLIADLPLLTAGLIVLLMVIFALEKRLAFDIDKDGSLSVHSLIAFGASRLRRCCTPAPGIWWATVSPCSSSACGSSQWSGAAGLR
jgi:hypothetical protein